MEKNFHFDVQSSSTDDQKLYIRIRVLILHCNYNINVRTRFPERGRNKLSKRGDLLKYEKKKKKGKNGNKEGDTITTLLYPGIKIS